MELAYTTNSDPKIVANYYIDAVNLKKGCPKMMRADRGTENVYIEQLHIYIYRPVYVLEI